MKKARKLNPELTLCKWVEEGQMNRYPGEYMKRVYPARYLCMKCGRTSPLKKYLCEPRVSYRFGDEKVQGNSAHQDRQEIGWSWDYNDYRNDE